MQQRNKEKQIASQEYQERCAPKPQMKTKNVPSMVANSIIEKNSSMAWGTTIDRVTAEINPFPYTREIKHLTLKDLETYLIPMVLRREIPMA